uniref:Uncharacterized protein n=1 Tax=Arundo donax TaxID=35708 RepID=A0A0A8ZY23_ARUDO
MASAMENRRPEGCKIRRRWRGRRISRRQWCCPVGSSGEEWLCACRLRR